MDRMDDIWKDRFNSEDLPLGEWNTPDDIVWQNIADSTVREDGKRRAVLWIWTVTGLFVLLLGIMLLKGNNFLSNSEDSIENNSIGQLIQSSNTNGSSTINESSDSSSKKYHIPTVNNAAVSQLTEKVTNSKLAAEQTVSSTETNKQKTAITANKKHKSTTSSDRLDANKFKESTDKTKLANELIQKQEAIPVNQNSLPTSISIQDQKETTNSGTTLELITNDEASSLITVDPIGLDLTTTAASIKEVDLNLNDELDQPKSAFPISITASIGASYWKHEISKNYTNDLSPFDFNYTNEFGYLLDVDVAVPLGSRFALSTGLDYEQINISSGHNSELNYNPADEGTDPSNAYALSLATPYGLAGAEFRFERGEEVGDDPVELLVDFHSGHSIRNFSVPLNLEYYPLGKKRIISPILKAGFGVNYLSGISNKIKSIDTHHSAIQYDDSESSSFMAPNITKWHYDYRLGLGARIQWRSDFAIILNYERVAGINPIFKQDAYNTRINRQHFSIGLNKVLLNIR